MTFDVYSALAGTDAGRERSSSGVGPSSFFGAECQTGRTFAGHQAVNDNADKLPAILGTAIHSALEQALADQGQHEITVEYAGITGHADFLPHDPADLLVDWKTTTLKKLAYIKRDGPTKTYRAQASFYAMATGRTRVRIVYIPRDGGRKDIHTAEFDRDDALVHEAVAWYYALRARVARGDIPAPSPPWAALAKARDVCARYCEFFDRTGTQGCPGPEPAPKLPPSLGGLFTPPAAT
ncbi:PD-(D/E)XK nuclease family protein [Parafrankia sp. FMc6]|uniref:PD-(D/E)XK nuclease family protein n=1 Tax=Parafrankia soli TaxID=2599596 RepID=UPI0034D462BD